MPRSLSNKTIQDNLELSYCLAMESKEGKEFLKYVQVFEVCNFGLFAKAITP
jgi:hypothetical protein